MAYEARHLRRQKIRYNNANDDNPIVGQLIHSGAKLTPDAAPTIQIFNPSGTSILTATSTGVTLTGTVFTYPISTTTTATWPVSTGYRAHWVVTSSSLTYELDQMFDIVKFVPFGWISRDQLVALDDRVKAMQHNEDEDFSEVIESVRDIIQMDIETKSIDDDRLLEDMILDHSRVAVVARFKILAQIFREKYGSESEDAKEYEGMYDTYMRQMLKGIKYDKGQDLTEENTQGRLTQMRLTT